MHFSKPFQLSLWRLGSPLRVDYILCTLFLISAFSFSGCIKLKDRESISKLSPATPIVNNARLSQVNSSGGLTKLDTCTKLVRRHSDNSYSILDCEGGPAGDNDSSFKYFYQSPKNPSLYLTPICVTGKEKDCAYLPVKVKGDLVFLYRMNMSRRSNCYFNDSWEILAKELKEEARLHRLRQASGCSGSTVELPEADTLDDLFFLAYLVSQDPGESWYVDTYSID